MDRTEPDKTQIMRDWKKLCEEIGVRLAGTEGEVGAARYILSELEKAGCSNCISEKFSCRSLKKGDSRVEVKTGSGWEEVESAALIGSGSTEGTVEGEAIWLEMPEQASLLRSGNLEGRIAVLFGPLPEIIDDHIRLVESNPLAVVQVDHRLPFNWAKNDGTYPLWVKKHGFPATVTVPYTEAWKWRKMGGLRLRVRSDMDITERDSQNVMGELAGTDPGLGVIIAGAHHDSQAGNVGADDNASGVVAILALARMLKGQRLKRTVRFVSFGTEEQLSVGSAEYVKLHREELPSVKLMVNFDSISSPMGHNQMFCTGGPALSDFACDSLKAGGLHVQLKKEAVPFADHFPFSVFGVPSLWFFRENFPGGRWQHHSVHDNLENVSVDVLTEIVSAASLLIHDASLMEELPFERGLDPELREKTLTLARTLFGFSV
jgi:Iap family predicted aminopeptidase